MVVLPSVVLLSQEITEYTIQWKTAFGAAGELKALTASLT